MNFRLAYKPPARLQTVNPCAAKKWNGKTGFAFKKYFGRRRNVAGKQSRKQRARRSVCRLQIADAGHCERRKCVGALQSLKLCVVENTQPFMAGELRSSFPSRHGRQKSSFVLTGLGTLPNREPTHEWPGCLQTTIARAIFQNGAASAFSAKQMSKRILLSG